MGDTKKCKNVTKNAQIGMRIDKFLSIFARNGVKFEVWRFEGLVWPYDP